ncbi:hypothetical protein BD289DRAFT_478881 [Coniella lustricola]|uniref:Uncharacterized protein n=1 Tax=Coniella lustricola TaxID=2025994 RepID=A0A2T3ALC9_9PEZI|nr:hypothetical protein BD289DRAFT_478881 [Coniella lustricola]
MKPASASSPSGRGLSNPNDNDNNNNKNNNNKNTHEPPQPPQRHHLHPPTPSASLAGFQHASLPTSRPGPHPATSTAASRSSATKVSYAGPLHKPKAASSSSCSRRNTTSSLPFSFPFFQVSSNTSVTSLVPSTAEGKPIPLDHSTAAHRTSALRELNSNYPSPVARHQCTKSSGAQSSTYSQPVIVRTYSGPPGSRGHSRSGSHSARRGTLSTTSTSVSFVSPPAHSRPAGLRQYGGLLNMARGKAKKKIPWPWGREDEDEHHPIDRLPPPDAFSFKTIMANLQAQSNEMDTALDGIAEIYARSRYSLSNQYEVHVTPHGSGSSFVSSVPSSSDNRRRGHPRSQHDENGPTLQAIHSEHDENGASSARSRQRRRHTGRRRSGAYSTLETIMSSSRSSEEDKSKKKSAAELADKVRGRASSNSVQNRSGSPTSSKSTSDAKKTDESSRNLTRKRSKSFANAIIYADPSKIQTAGEIDSPRNSSAALVSEPSKPQTSSSHLEIRTTPNDLFGDASTQGSQPESSEGAGSEQTVTQYLQSLTPRDELQAPGSLKSGLGNWVPWKTVFSTAVTASQPGGPPASSSHAEGSLRELLKSVDGKQKGKSVERLV